MHDASLPKTQKRAVFFFRGSCFILSPEADNTQEHEKRWMLLRVIIISSSPKKKRKKKKLNHANALSDYMSSGSYANNLCGQVHG